MAAAQAQKGRLDLLEGEEILYEIEHHWLTGIITLIIPVGVLLIFLCLYIFLSVGGDLLVEYRGGGFALDLLDWLYIGLAAFLGAIWVLFGIAEKEGLNGRRWVILGMTFAVVIVIAFRAAGGEIFAPGVTSINLLRPLGLLLLVLAVVAGIVVAYIVVDLLHDRLYLTNMRVIYYNSAVLIPRLIEKQVQQELMLEDVQNVLSKTETYLQHWLNYGNIKVTAANAGRPISFSGAAQAKEMQRRIFGARGDLTKRQNNRNFAQLINARVYDDKPEKAAYRYDFAVAKMPPFLNRLFDDNPNVNFKQGEVTWYPHWIFLARALLAPLGFLAMAAVLLAVGVWLELGLALLIAGGILVLLVFALWIAYAIEDYRNDKYILTASALIDIDKRPFGPESRRTAGLGTIQTVTYTTTFFSNLLGYGNVVAKTAGQGGAFTFIGVPRPRDVAATINQHITAFRKGERERTLDESLSLLRQFHLYQGKLGELKPKTD